MERQRRINPKGDAKYHIENGKDKVGFDVKSISAYKGRGVFVTTSFQKGDFLLEYRGELISKEECERRQRVYHDTLKVFLFEFYFDGKLWCVDAAKEDGSLGRLVNDDHVCPNAKMKYLTVQGKPHLCLFAIREISQGEEVTYNYGDSDWPWRCKIRTEKRHSKVAANNANQTDPDLEPLHRSAEVSPEAIQSQMPEDNLKQTDPNLISTNRNAEVSPEAIQSQMPEDNLKQTDPNLISTNRNAEVSPEAIQSQMPEDNLKQTDPNLISTNRNAEVSPEAIQSQMPEDNLKQTDPNLISTNRNAEVSPEAIQSQMPEDNLKQTDPNLISTNRNAEVSPEAIQSQMPEDNLKQTDPNLISTNRNAEVSPEAIQSQMPEDNLKQTDPNLISTNRNAEDLSEETTFLSSACNVEQCQKHYLVCATLSSLDKCAQCVGPVSSMKWLGYQCKFCSTVWHAYCLKRLKKNIQDQLQHSSQEKELFEYSAGHSSDKDTEVLPESHDISDDQCNSDEDYIPDSEDEDEDSKVSLLSKQSTVGQKERNLAILDTNMIEECHTISEPVPSPSQCWPPICRDKMGDNAAGTLGPATSLEDRVSQKKLEGQDKQESTLQMSNKNFCFVCGKPQSKISRHLRTHKDHAEIAYAFSLPDDSKKRKVLVGKMRNKGNFRHNTKVLQAGQGPLKVKRMPKAKVESKKFIHCMYCQGMYIRKDLWRHVRRCPCKPVNEDPNEKCGRTKVLALAMAQESTMCQQISEGVWKLLSVMNQDDVASVVRNDLTIIQFAQSLYNKHGKDPTKYEYIRQKLREVGRLLLCLRTEFSIHNLEDAVKPANFQKVVQAIKTVAGFNEETCSYQIPSLALKLGHTLQKVCDIIHCRALIAESEELIRSTEVFKKLYNSKWSELVSHTALNTLSQAKYNKPLTLPFTEDVQCLHQYLKKAGETAFCNLSEKATPKTYGELAKVTLAQVIVFNRRRAGEVSKMHLQGFQKRDDTKLHEDVAMGLSKVEQKLCNYFSRVEIMGKRGRKVAILLTPKVVDALSLLTTKRDDCGVSPTNLFLFARPTSQSHYRGQDCLRFYANQCGAKHPEFLRSTHLRKHVATLSQVLNLKNNELDQVADFLGHDIRVHREFYRLPVPTTQLAKISKLLLSMEKGQLSTLQGKSLDDIDVEDELALSDTEAMESESESDDSESERSAHEFRNTVLVEAADSTPTMPQMTPQRMPQTTPDTDNIGVVSTSSIEDANQTLDEKSSNQELRRGPKKPWSTAEVVAVMRHFKNHISKGKLASKTECSHCKLVEGPVLANRTVQNIRDFVRNRGIAAKRQALKQK
ncbi:uncharacterized protein [Nothobranchius furzeri]|uniref:uncharacterized protein n=1 Tax=Nothobranchius furzeri TaxID=105023 RepID=UPI003904CA34